MRMYCTWLQVRKNRHIEIIPLSTGCLGACTYCKTKHARGVLGSYTMEAIVARAQPGSGRPRGQACETHGSLISSNSLPLSSCVVYALLPTRASCAPVACAACRCGRSGSALKILAPGVSASQTGNCRRCMFGGLYWHSSRFCSH